MELSDGKVPAYAICSIEEPLPPRPYDLKPAVIQIQEKEGGLGWHPAVRSATREGSKVTGDPHHVCYEGMIIGWNRQQVI